MFDSGLLDLIEEAAPAPGSAFLCHTYSTSGLLETVEVAQCLFTFFFSSRHFIYVFLTGCLRTSYIMRVRVFPHSTSVRLGPNGAIRATLQPHWDTGYGHCYRSVLSCFTKGIYWWKDPLPGSMCPLLVAKGSWKSRQ